VDVLDPALLRSGRLDRKIEFPLPNEEARAQILKIHSRKMTVDDAVNWPELARSTDEFGGAQLKAVCVEAGMIALRMGKNKISHEHYVDAIAEVQAKKKGTLSLSLLLPFLFSRILLTRSRYGQLLCIDLELVLGGLACLHNQPCIIENSWKIFSI
jgi:26S proteasome regulatory subunit T5